MGDLVKKLILFLSLLLMTQLTAATISRHNLCRVWYSFDIFQTYLNLSVDPKGPTLIMDQHIPYGIRPMGNAITHMACDRETTTLQISAKNGFNQDIRFGFSSQGEHPTQSGTVTYLDPKGNPVSSKDWECSLDAVKKLCLEL